MQDSTYKLAEAVEAIARQDRVLEFKDEGENDLGIPVGKLTLRSSAEPVYPDGRWVTKRHALALAAA